VDDGSIGTPFKAGVFISYLTAKVFLEAPVAVDFAAIGAANVALASARNSSPRILSADQPSPNP
jgi:hypothetical protein